MNGTDHITSPEIPIVMRMSLNALLSGLAAREKAVSRMTVSPFH